MARQSKEIKTGTIPVDIAFHISDHLEIQDMENWAEALGMQEQFREKILEAKQMHSRIENLRFLNANMIETVATTDYRLTFRTMKRLIAQAESRSKWHENLDEGENTPIQKVYGGFTGLKEDGRFLEMRFASDGQYPDF